MWLKKTKGFLTSILLISNIAKKQGKYKGRKPLPFDEAKFRAECMKWRTGAQTANATMKKLDMKRNRFYQIVKKLGI